MTTNQKPIVLKTAGAIIPITLPASYQTLTIPHWATNAYNPNPTTGALLWEQDELHSWSVSFEKVSEIASMEIMSELVEDALKAADWHRSVKLGEIAFHKYDVSTVETLRVYIRDGLKIVVKPNSIEFDGKAAVFIDSDADIVSDDELLMKVIDWIYEGGPCPIMNGALNRLVKKANTYPTSNDNKLTRKNNRKK